MSYRPEGCDNPYPDEPREAIRGGVHTAFEEGADAMLEALKARGFYVPYKPIELTPDGNYVNFDTNRKEWGWLVFIPDNGG